MTKQYIVVYLKVFLWMGLIFMFSNQPILPGSSEFLLDFFLKKSAHIGVYAVLCILWFRAINHKNSLQKNYILPLLFTVLYGVSDEIHQSFVPGRTGRMFDVSFDTYGAVIALIWIRKILTSCKHIEIN